MEDSGSMPTASVLVQGADGYLGRQLLSAIATRSNLWDQGAEPPPPSDDNPFDLTRRLVVLDDLGKTLEQSISDADIIVVNLFGDLDEATALIKAIRTSRYTRAKFVICLSTVLTWAGSDRPPSLAPISEAQFRKRIPCAAVSRHKLLETLVVNSSRDMVSTCVVAAGVLYGQGERDLHPWFKQAWLCDPLSLPVISPGTNTIPTIHVNDFATVIVRLAERPTIQSQYIIAVDKSRCTQQEIATAIAEVLSSGTIEMVDVADAIVRRDTVAPHIATANIIVDREQSFVSQLEMEWRCEDGPVNAMAAIVDEFVAVRNLQPLRVCVIGPPGAGRSFWSNRIAARFYLPIVAVRDVIEVAKRDNAELQLGKDGRIPVPVLAALVRAALNRSELRNKGYVLDGYPRSFDEAKALFDVAGEGGSGEDESGPPAEVINEDDEQDEAHQRRRTVPQLPNRIVALSCPDGVALEWARLHPGHHIPGHSDEKGLTRRITAWNKVMATSPDHHPRIWFTHNDIELLDVNVSDPLDILDDAVAAYVGGSTPPHNYHPNEEEIATEAAAAEERARVEQEMELERERQRQMQAVVDAETRQRKAEERETMLVELAQKESAMIEERAKPLREYLAQRVLPQLSEGLYELAQVQPDDPIDYLAEYLFRVSATTEH